MSHHCHARNCIVSVKPELLMCLKHWRMVPKAIQRDVWATYREGQCDDKNPSQEWHSAADAAIGYVAISEGYSVRETEISALKALGFTVFKRRGGDLGVVP